MKMTVCKACTGAKKSTAAIPLIGRKRLEQEHGLPVKTGLAVQVRGRISKSPRNFIVTQVNKEDPLKPRDDVIRLGLEERRRIGVAPGEVVNVAPLEWETWFHGTSAPDPMVIVREGWIVGMGRVYGEGVYLTTDTGTARSYGRSAVITFMVAWGQHLTWPPLPGGQMHRQLVVWCNERNLSSTRLMLAGPRWRTNPHILQFARLHGHYHRGRDSSVRVIPGPVGGGFLPQRCRAVMVTSAAGQVLWQRWNP